MGINERFLAVMQEVGLSKGEFAARIGISQGLISHIASGRNKPGLEVVIQLLEQFTQINPEYMLFGKGPMKRPEAGEGQKQELLKLLEEVRLVNEMNYNTLKLRIESLEKALGKP